MLEAGGAMVFQVDDCIDVGIYLVVQFKVLDGGLVVDQSLYKKKIIGF